jgi:hypothetical protein
MEQWTDFQKYLIGRIDAIEARLRPIENRVYFGTAIIALTVSVVIRIMF